MKLKTSPVKKCPRCKTKCFATSKKCHECNLIFERLNYVSNRSARKNVLKLRKSDYIMTAEWPTDAKKKTALLLCGLAGYTGAHNFYLGRFWKAFTMLIGLIFALTLVILSDYGLGATILYSKLHFIGIIPGGSVLVFWILDFIYILLERYKIPVSIDNNLYGMKKEFMQNESAKNEIIKDKDIKDKKDKNEVIKNDNLVSFNNGEYNSKNKREFKNISEKHKKANKKRKNKVKIDKLNKIKK